MLGTNSTSSSLSDVFTTNAYTTEIINGEKTIVKRMAAYKFVPKSINNFWNKLVCPPLIVLQQKNDFKNRQRAQIEEHRISKMDRLINHILKENSSHAIQSKIGEVQYEKVRHEHVHQIPTDTRKSSLENISIPKESLHSLDDSDKVQVLEYERQINQLIQRGQQPKTETNPLWSAGGTSSTTTETKYQTGDGKLESTKEARSIVQADDDNNPNARLAGKHQVFVLDVTEASKQFVRRLTSEFFGTAALTFTFAASAVELGLGHINQTGSALIDGFALMALVYSLGGISGSHLNPLVSLAFTLRTALPWIWLVFYWIAQFVGSLVGAAILRGLYLSNAYRGTNQINAKQYTLNSAMGLEVVITFLLVFTILLTSTRGKVVGANASIAVGGIMIVNILISASFSSGSMNWFRTFGPAVVNGPRNQGLWPFAVGPLLGCLLAVLAVRSLAGGIKTTELAAAAGGGEGDTTDVAESK